ncbi:MAG TPA: methyltransferase domain-containing protein [Vicinamibacterales bacterium]|nr:methyltransferase domain-containing protein [Vicinamibacterales bacterium]
MPRFPTISSNPNSLEHLKNPLAVLTACRRALCSDGVLAIGVPTLDGLPQHGKLNYCVNESKHVVAFTRRSLAQLLARAGFDLLAYTRVPHRCCVIATPATSEEATAPLRDAVAALRAYRRVEAGWWAAIVPVRLWAAWDNASTRDAGVSWHIFGHARAIDIAGGANHELDECFHDRHCLQTPARASMCLGVPRTIGQRQG